MQDAARLVFVSVKDAKPKRKVAVPIPEGGAWDQFCRQVQAKLKLLSIDSMYLASSGERITRLDQLQDIDELFVVEGAASQQHLQGGSSSSNGYLQQQSVPSIHRVGVADTEITPAMSNQLDVETDSNAKYAKRQTDFQRTLKRVFPNLFQQQLPMTTK
jgi:hypothetical protein